jgi:glycosyltransferase involved in cell wall biosynthesis
MTAVSGPGRTVGQRLKWLCYFGEAVLLARWLVTREFTHLHCHFGNSGASTGMLAAQLADIPFSMTCHGSELENIDGHRLPQKVKQAAFVACVSEYGKTKLTAVTPASEWSKLYIVRCGLHEFPVPSRPPANDVPRILCVGRLAPEKGHHVLLDALATLRTKGVDFACTLIGDGPRRAALESRVDALRLRSAVTLTGSRKPEEVARAYAGANVVVLASFSEGVPVVLMEAMAHARPVVATRVGGVPELVRDGLTGVLVESGDAEGLADALQRILSDPEWAADLAEKAARHVRSEFNLEASVDRLIELFDSAARTTQQSAIRQPDATVCHSGP